MSLRAVPLRLSWHSVSSDMMVALGPCSRIEVLGAILDCKWSMLSRTTSFCFCGRVQTCSTLAQKQAPSGARERLGPDNHSTSMSVCTKGLAISIDRHLPPCLHLAGTKGSSPVDQRTYWDPSSAKVAAALALRRLLRRIEAKFSHESLDIRLRYVQVGGSSGLECTRADLASRDTICHHLRPR